MYKQFEQFGGSVDTTLLGKGFSLEYHLHRKNNNPLEKTDPNSLPPGYQSCLTARVSRGIADDECPFHQSCRSLDGSCSAYPFQPNILSCQSQRTWMTGGKFNVKPFVPHDNTLTSYQAWIDPNFTDVWIVHAADGAGAQATDCGGDVAYFENVDDVTEEQSCPTDQSYPAHFNQCAFYHHGKNTWYDKYQCGWWRGYFSAWDAAVYNAWDDLGCDAQGAPVTKTRAMDCLRNCDICPEKDATLHTFRQKDPANIEGYFTGIQWPWVCASADDPAAIDWTGTSNFKCYCDNEPWGGRDAQSTTPNLNMKLLYCATFKGSTDDMYCDLIVFTTNQAGNDCVGATIQKRAFNLRTTKF